MDSFSLPRSEDLRVCPTCGAWIRSERSACPWCGTANAGSAPAPATIAAIDTLPAGGILQPSSEEPTRAYQRVDEEPPSTLDEGPPDAPEEPSPLTSPGRRFWVRAFTMAGLLVALVIISLGGLGVYQGLHDRQVQDQRAAIRYFEQGQGLMEEERYELAVASFREAVRLEPNFVAAEQMLEAAQYNADVAAGRIPTETPTSEATEATTIGTGADATATASPTRGPNREEELFEEAVAALEREDWGIAAATFDLLTSQAPGYRTEEVEDGLFESNMEAGREALEDEELDDALRHFDRALAVRPNSIEAQQQRRMTSAYRTGLRAFTREDWSMAADQLRTVYLLDPEFLDTTEMLAEAHYNLGQEFEARSIWCSAAQQYRSSVAVVANDQISRLAQTANNRCVVRATAAPPVVVRSSPTSTVRNVQPTVTGESGPRPTNTAGAPTQVVTATATIPVVVVESTPTIAPVLPSPTFAPPPPTATSVPAPAAGFQLAGMSENLGAGCGGHYILGTVRARDGSPLSGVTILVVDQHGNRFTAVSKVDPAGAYDLPIPFQVSSYEVMIASGDAVISPRIAVQHTEAMAQSPQACHILNWQQQ
ncbi:MAG TPA: hypothetical protein VF707_06370 [Ardenticatenaceae bacterium]